MTVGRKLVVMLVFVALAPLGVFAVTALRAHEDTLRHELAALHQKTAEHGARTTASTLDSARHAVRGLAGAIPWGELSSEERSGALLLAYDQLEDLAIAVLLDERGRGIGTSVFRDRDARHPHVDAATLDAFSRVVPFAAVRPEVATGAPFSVAGQPPMIALGIPVAGPNGARWVLALALSLRGLCDELRAAAPRNVTTVLASGDRVLCGTPIRGDTLAAAASTPQGWTVTALQPRETAFASLHAVRLQSLLWIALGVVGAIGAGVVVAQAIQKPLQELTRGADAIAAGDLGHRVDVTSRDELGELAGAFNHMSGELAAKHAEIQEWNRELQTRVDARTHELREAQEQLLHSRKLGAIAALGAGVAHEINNPLTGIVGLSQVLLAKKDSLDERTLRNVSSIEREALRIRDIVERLGKLAQASVADATRLDTTVLLESALGSHAEQLASREIAVERELAPRLPLVLGNAAQLQHAVAQIIDNALRAMADRGRLRIAARAVADDAVIIEISDTGRGIAPELVDRIFEPFFTTKSNWHGIGLGLAIVHRIIEAHQGSIRVTSAVGKGTTMVITLPAAERAAHLA